MRIYTTVSTDTLPSLAARFGVEPSMLRQINGLTDPVRLTTGLSLLIPTGESHTSAIGEIFSFASARPMPTTVLECCTYCSIATYSFTADGNLMEDFVPDALGELSRFSVLPVITLANLNRGGYAGELAHRLLSNEQSCEALLSSLTALCESKGIKGVNLSFQYLFPFDGADFCRFLRCAARQFHEKGLFLFVTISGDTHRPKPDPVTETAGELADRLILLSGWQPDEYSPPRAILPISGMRQSLEWALGCIPREKLLAAIPCSGYNRLLPHRAGDAAVTVSPAAAVNLAISAEAEIKYDSETYSPYFSYRDALGMEHIVHFEDCRSLHGKLQLIREIGLRGAALWGGADETVISLVGNMFEVEHLI